MPGFTFSDSDTDQSDLVSKVEFKLDEVTADGQTIGTNQSRIYEQAVEAMRTIITLAAANPVLRPRVYELAKDASSSSGSPVTTSDQGGYLRLEMPDDYIEFVRLRLAGWDLPVANTSEHYLSDDDKRYRIIKNSYSAPDASRPAVVQVSDPSIASGVVLEAYPSDTSADPVAVFSYLGDTAPEDVPYLLEEVLLYEAAANVLQTYRDEMNAANMAYNKARQIFQERASSLRQRGIAAGGDDE
jgi:hypothetical protein